VRRGGILALLQTSQADRKACETVGANDDDNSAYLLAGVS
jgi:hypothetical protein